MQSTYGPAALASQKDRNIGAEYTTILSESGMNYEVDECWCKPTMRPSLLRSKGTEYVRVLSVPSENATEPQVDRAGGSVTLLDLRRQTKR